MIGLSGWVSSRGSRLSWAHVGLQQPSELDGFKRGGAVIGGAGFQGIEPIIGLRQPAHNDDGDVRKLQQGLLQDTGLSSTEDNPCSRHGFRCNFTASEAEPSGQQAGKWVIETEKYGALREWD